MPVEILTHRDYRNFMTFLPLIKNAVKEWQLVDVHLLESASKRFTIQQIASMLQETFKEKTGKIYVGSNDGLFMLISSGYTPDILSKRVEKSLPGGSCEIKSGEVTIEGLKTVEIHIGPKSPGSLTGFSAVRFNRKERIIMVADDDMYMRTLAKKAVGTAAGIIEIDTGDNVIESYKTHAPDMVLLDIHLPGKNGMDLLADVQRMDSDAYVVMLSADSSQENVLRTMHTGAKGFLAKPLNKDKFMVHMKAAHIC